MFYEIARGGPPTKYELARLQDFEMVGRKNNFLLQLFDVGSDIAFMLVMFSMCCFSRTRLFFLHTQLTN